MRLVEIGPLTRKIYKVAYQHGPYELSHFIVSDLEWHQLLEENVNNDAFCVVPNLPVNADGFNTAYLGNIKILRGGSGVT